MRFEAQIGMHARQCVPERARAPARMAVVRMVAESALAGAACHHGAGQPMAPGGIRPQREYGHLTVETEFILPPIETRLRHPPPDRCHAAALHLAGKRKGRPHENLVPRHGPRLQPLLRFPTRPPPCHRPREPATPYLMGHLWRRSRGIFAGRPASRASCHSRTSLVAPRPHPAHALPPCARTVPARPSVSDRSY